MSKNCASCRHWSHTMWTANGLHECTAVEYENADDPAVLTDTQPKPVVLYGLHDADGWVNYYTPASHYCSLHKEF